MEAEELVINATKKAILRGTAHKEVQKNRQAGPATSVMRRAISQETVHKLDLKGQEAVAEAELALNAIKKVIWQGTVQKIQKEEEDVVAQEAADRAINAEKKAISLENAPKKAQNPVAEVEVVADPEIETKSL